MADALVVEVYRSPWFNLGGYLACTVRYSDGRKRTVLQHREIVERILGRKLEPWEIIHHKDENKRNNSPENLILTDQGFHINLHMCAAEYIEFVCPVCGNLAKKLARHIRHNRLQGKAGPYCSRHCAGKAHN